MYPQTELRMTPDDVAAAVEPAGFILTRIIGLPLYHYGAIFQKANRIAAGTLNRSLVKLRSMGQTCVIPQIEAPCIPRPRCRANGPRLELSCDGWPIREGTLRPCSAAPTLTLTTSLPGSRAATLQKR